MTVRPGVIHGLIGSNGSGKTTLLNLISGFYSVDAGGIEYGGRQLTKLSPYEVARTGIARTFQTPILVPRLNVLENVMLSHEQRDRVNAFSTVFRLPSGVRAERASRAAAMAALDEVDLAPLAAQSAGELSHGQQRLVELTRVLVARPGVVMLDEPAAGLSVPELEQLERILGILRSRGCAVLLIEHNVPLVLRNAQVVTVLHQGRVIVSGPPLEVEQHPDVIESFLGRLAAGSSLKVES
jgi:branched-chain amino acid transport system ATP-binding protein/branched-chain amino acid transport system permease protein